MVSPDKMQNVASHPCKCHVLSLTHITESCMIIYIYIYISLYNQVSRAGALGVRECNVSGASLPGTPRSASWELLVSLEVRILYIYIYIYMPSPPPEIPLLSYVV